jgi:hypothetical protein
MPKSVYNKKAHTNWTQCRQSKENIFKLHIKIKSLVQSKTKHDAFSSTKQISYFVDPKYEICPKSNFLQKTLTGSIYRKLYQMKRDICCTINFT